jgi:S-adenosylmethionine:tRNA ribosyltransferase-isomerase
MIKNSAFPDRLKISDFDYPLPAERIAKYPLEERDGSKLLVYRENKIEDSCFRNIDSFLQPNDLLVFNNTKVIPARLKFYKSTGAQIELFCLEPVLPSDYALALQSESCTWKCIVGNLKKWKDSVLEKKIRIDGHEICLKAEKKTDFSNSIEIHFTWDNPQIKFDKIIESAGTTPIPPYLNRESEDIDTIRYQTVYSSIKGSVAAPTAGLHFTENILNKLSNHHVDRAELTLHVGAGTFKPVQSEIISDHEMHTEYFIIKKEVIIKLLRHPENIVSVGTTTLRTLESLYWIAAKLQKNLYGSDTIYTIQQWDPYEISCDLSFSEAMERILEHMEEKNISELIGHTQIMIVPGYRPKSIKALITNFHQPKSTLLLLIASIVGNDWKKIYQFALNNNYRFLSYGDSSLLFL